MYLRVHFPFKLAYFNFFKTPNGKEPLREGLKNRSTAHKKRFGEDSGYRLDPH